MARQTAELKKMDKRMVEIEIEGISPLIMHRWSEKAKEEMLAKQMKKTVIRSAKDPEAQYQSSLYVLPDGRLAFPACAFKACAVRGGKSLGMTMTDSRCAFFVWGIYSARDGRQLIPVDGDPSMREDMVRLETGVADIRYRGQVQPWSAVLTVEYNASGISLEQLVNMIDAGGFGVGVGEWRPERNGEAGRFRVKTAG